MNLVEPQEPPELGELRIERTTEALLQTLLEHALDVAGESGLGKLMRADSLFKSPPWSAATTVVATPGIRAPWEVTAMAIAHGSAPTIRNFESCFTTRLLLLPANLGEAMPLGEPQNGSSPTRCVSIKRAIASAVDSLCQLTENKLLY